MPRCALPVLLHAALLSVACSEGDPSPAASRASNDGTFSENLQGDRDGQGSPVTGEPDDLAPAVTIPGEGEPRDPPVLLDGGRWYLEAYRRDPDEGTRIVPAAEREAHGLAFPLGGGLSLRSTCLRRDAFYDGYTGNRLTVRATDPRIFDRCASPEEGAPIDPATSALRDTFFAGGTFELEWRGETLTVSGAEGARFVFRDARSDVFPEPAEVTLGLLGQDWRLTSYRRADGGEVALPPSEPFPPTLRFPDLAPVIDTLNAVGGGSAFAVDYTLEGTSLSVGAVFEEGLDLLAPPSAAVERATVTVRRVLGAEEPLTVERGTGTLAITASTGEALVFRASGVARFRRDTSERLEIDVIAGGDPAAAPLTTIVLERAMMDADTLRAPARRSDRIGPDVVDEPSVGRGARGTAR